MTTPFTDTEKERLLQCLGSMSDHAAFMDEVETMMKTCYPNVLSLSPHVYSMH